MKYVIEHTYTNIIPLSFIPRSAAALTGRESFKKLNDLMIGNLCKKSFKPYNPEGFDGIEFNFSIESLFTKGWEIQEKRLEEFKNKNWPLYTFHAGHESELGCFRDAYTSLADDDDITKQKIRVQIRAAAELQKATQAGKNPIIVFHTGHLPQKLPVPDAVLKNLEIAAEEAESKKVIVALENMQYAKKGYLLGSDYKDLEYILKKIDTPWLRVCFDWGHANAYAWEYAKKTKNAKEYMENFSYQSELIDSLNKKICYAHIHYNKSHQKSFNKTGKDEHLPLTRIPERFIMNFERTIKEMLAKTLILEHDFIHLELFPFTFWPKGSTRKEQIQSINMLKRIIDAEIKK